MKIINRDFENWTERIEKAKNKLLLLPNGWLPYPLHKKRELKRRQCQDEIAHVERLFDIAGDGIGFKRCLHYRQMVGINNNGTIK